MAVKPGSHEYSARRIDRLVSKWENALGDAFRLAARSITDGLSLDQIAGLLERGDIDGALGNLGRAARNFAGVQQQAVLAAAEDATSWLNNSALTAKINFDQTNTRAVNLLRNNRFELVREFSAGQRAAVREAMTAATTDGLNPRDQARRFRESIGLTDRQVRAVNNYRRLLREGDAGALDRALRDKRFDGTVARAIRDGDPLTDGQINKMVTRYRERYIKYRSEVIGRTEALRAAHQGTEEAFAQAIANGDISPDEIERKWTTSRDARVRDTHNSLNGQTRPMNGTWTTSAGNVLRFPGDTSAPPEETIQCRCALATRIVARTDTGEIEKPKPKPKRKPKPKSKPKTAPTPAPASVPKPAPDAAPKPEFAYQAFQPFKKRDEAETFIAENIADQSVFKSDITIKSMNDAIRHTLEVQERFGLRQMAAFGSASGVSRRLPRNGLAFYFPRRVGGPFDSPDSDTFEGWAPGAIGFRKKGLTGKGDGGFAGGEAGKVKRLEERERIVDRAKKFRRNDKAAFDEVNERFLADTDGPGWKWTVGGDARAITIHENGHRLHYDNWKEINAILKDIDREWWALISRYGTTNSKEYVAEAFTLYMVDPSQHYRIHPALLKWFRDNDRNPDTPET